jgi:lysine 2,3-aminomutase
MQKRCIYTNVSLKKAGYDKLSDADAQELNKHFQMSIPQTFIESQNTDLINQVIPQLQELEIFKEELVDPIGDLKHAKGNGIIHRYHNRVLLTPTHLCAMYCRFCFRKSRVSKSQYNLTKTQLLEAINYIQIHSDITEVILSGGDPFILSDTTLLFLIKALSEIAHLRVIRFHTRILTANPLRITPDLIQCLKNSQKSIWIVVHVNAAQEITPDFIKTVKDLRASQIGLLSQSVLLKTINNCPNKLINLFNQLIQVGIKPYYLHYPDLVQGTNHFRVPLVEAITLVKQVKQKISGIAMPQFIIDIPGGFGKIPVQLHNMEQISQNTWAFESPLTGKMIHVSYPSE